MAAETYLIGIAGPSGAGKSFLAKHLQSSIDARVLELDRYYRDLSHLPIAERARVNFDAPEALEDELLIQQIARLQNRETVQLPVYDFTTHTRSQKTDSFGPAEVIIVEGLFTLHWPRVREFLGTKVYVDLNDEVCLTRRIARDVRERGRTVESVIEQYQTTVAPMAQCHVRPTMAHADIVVIGTEPITMGVARVVEHYRRRRQ